MVVLPGAARGPPGPGYGCYRAPYSQPVGLCPSRVGGSLIETHESDIGESVITNKIDPKNLKNCSILSGI